MSLTPPDLWQHLQHQLFPMLAGELCPLSELDEQFCQWWRSEIDEFANHAYGRVLDLFEIEHDLLKRLG